MRPVLLLLLLTPLAHAGSPEGSVRDALRDAARLPPDRAAKARYLSLHHLSEKAELDKWDKVLRFAVNALSTETELIAPQRLRPDLWRVFEDDYGGAWEKAWAALKDVEPFYHQKAVLLDDVYEVKEVPYGHYGPDGKWVTTEIRKVKKLVKKGGAQEVGAAPWLVSSGIADLIKITQTESPVVRADWWLHQSLAQEGRKGTGYYDYLGFGDNEKDFYKAGEVNVKGAQRLKKELRAFTGRSEVVHNNRELEWFDGILDAFRSSDYERSDDKQNVARLLDGDAKPDAHEYYVRAPNGLWWFFLANGAGKRVNFAPDNIGSNGKAPGTDKRIHVGIACIQCHANGLQPVNNWAKNIYGDAPFQFIGPDYDKVKRLRSIYLRNFMTEVERLNVDYGKVIKDLNGFTATENAEAVAEAYWGYDPYYRGADRSLEQTAHELGLKDADDWKAKLEKAARSEKRLDPVLVALFQGLPLRTDWWEEVFPFAMEIARRP